MTNQRVDLTVIGSENQKMTCTCPSRCGLAVQIDTGKKKS